MNTHISSSAFLGQTLTSANKTAFSMTKTESISWDIRPYAQCDLPFVTVLNKQSCAQTSFWCGVCAGTRYALAILNPYLHDMKYQSKQNISLTISDVARWNHACRAIPFQSTYAFGGRGGHRILIKIDQNNALLISNKWPAAASEWKPLCNQVVCQLSH